MKCLHTICELAFVDYPQHNVKKHAHPLSSSGYLASIAQHFLISPRPICPSCLPEVINNCFQQKFSRRHTIQFILPSIFVYIPLLHLPANIRIVAKLALRALVAMPRLEELTEQRLRVHAKRASRDSRSPSRAKPAESVEISLF